MLHPSSAELGSALIQLELEASQLGSARRKFESARVAKNFTIKVVGYFFFLLSCFRSNKVNLFKTNLNLMCHIVKKRCNYLHKTVKINGIIQIYDSFANNFSSDSARVLEIASSARLSSETCQLGSARKIPA